MIKYIYKVHTPEVKAAYLAAQAASLAAMEA